MSLTTDPAREFTDLCTRIRVHTSMYGADYLASEFDVNAWSTDFMLILATIHQRITGLGEMIDQTDLDRDIKAAAISCLESIRTSFSQEGLVNRWSDAVTVYLTDANIMPIRMASAYVRPNYGYIVPDAEEIGELTTLVDELLSWLNEHELCERDFIRSAIIEGLTAFKFRVERVGWYGWSNTMQSIKDVVSAYLILERGRPDENISPPYDAMLKKVRDGLSTIFERVKYVKDVQETGDWLLRGYAALHLSGSAYSNVAGLLTHSQ